MIIAWVGVDLLADSGRRCVPAAGGRAGAGRGRGRGHHAGLSDPDGGLWESRKTESEGIASRLKARALAIGGDDGRRRARRAGGRRQLRRRGEGDRRGGGAAEEQGRH